MSICHSDIVAHQQYHKTNTQLILRARMKNENSCHLFLSLEGRNNHFWDKVQTKPVYFQHSGYSSEQNMDNCDIKQIFDQINDHHDFIDALNQSNSLTCFQRSTKPPLFSCNDRSLRVIKVNILLLPIISKLLFIYLRE